VSIIIPKKTKDCTGSKTDLAIFKKYPRLTNNFTAKRMAILARVVELSIWGGKYALNSSINLSSMYRRHDIGNCRNREMACKFIV
jgi:hypothetical protein